MEDTIVVKAENLVKSYTAASTQEATHVLSGLSMDICRGEFAAIMGPSGVGKSTLLYLLGSLEDPDSGQVELRNEDKNYSYNKLSRDEIASLRNKSIGFVFQFHHLLPEFDTFENVMMPAFIAGVPYSEAKDKAEKLLERVGIYDRRRHKPMELSGGEQQRAAIARSLINDPIIVFADEPTGNLDTKNSNQVLDLIQQLRKEYSLTFVVATHSREVADIGERILIMGDGIIKDEVKK